MPFTKAVKGPHKGKYRSPSGNLFTPKQVRHYYANKGFQDGGYTPSRQEISKYATSTPRYEDDGLLRTLLGIAGRPALIEGDIRFPYQRFTLPVGERTSLTAERGLGLFGQEGIPDTSKRDLRFTLSRSFQDGGTVNDQRPTLLELLTGGKYQTSKDIPPLTATKGHKELQWLIDRFTKDHGVKYQGGVDPAVANLALNPLVTAKQIPSLLKIVKNIGLKNPLYHFTGAPTAQKILKTGKIKPTGYYPIFNPKTKELVKKTKSLSVTRDPMFASRPHGHISTDVRFIMDRDDLVKKGFKLRPYAEKGYRKTKPHWDWKFPNIGKIKYKGEPKTKDWLEKKQIELTRQGRDWKRELKRTGLELEYVPDPVNPSFEFEERIARGLPTSDIKMIDFLRFPKGFTHWADPMVDMFHVASDKADLLKGILERDIPIMMSKEARGGIKRMAGLLTSGEFKRVMSSPTYTYNPFKLRK